MTDAPEVRAIKAAIASTACVGGSAPWIAVILAALAPPLAGAQTDRNAAAEDGARIYEASCVACHQQGGKGIPGAFPPLAQHVPSLLQQPGGRNYLLKVVLFGLEGKISIDGAEFQAVMPPWTALSDSEVASVLNYVSSAWGNQATLPSDFSAFSANEVTAARQPALVSTAVLALRPVNTAGTSAQDNPAVSATAPVAFTDEQTARGKLVYTRRCVDCHGSTLDNGEFGGAPLNGSYFKDHWGSGSVAGLIAYTKAKMPPDGPGSLSDQAYVDVVAFLLDANGYPRGDKELPADPQAQQTMTLKFSR